MNEELFSNSELFQQGQIRLSELSVFNWGSFHGLHTAGIDAQGTLVTGDNGAGKSTLIDGLMALLLPAGKASFNVAAAQGDRSDRSLLSYMRGSFGSAHDGTNTRVKSKRETSVVTGLRALYRADDGSEITLAALFWTTAATNALSDVKRLYVVARKNLILESMLDAFGEGNVRHLKAWLKDDTAITCCDDNFSDYQTLYRNYLQMENKNAPALLSRALGLKKIDDLTRLIRELVLEPSSVKLDAKKVVDEFQDLVATFDELTDAKAQVSQLENLPTLNENILEYTKTLDAQLLEKQQLPIYFAEQFKTLWAAEITSLNTAMETLLLKLKRLDQAEQDADDAVQKRHEEYLQSGGNKIESLRAELHHIRQRLTEVIREASTYQALCQGLALTDSLDEAAFNANQSTVKEKLASIEESTLQSQDHFADISAKFSDKEQAIKALQSEIKDIEQRPDSNIPIKFQQLRDDIQNALSLKSDALLFLGELIDVKDDEKAWQGAIERALGGLRTTLLVDHKNYRLITRWLNARHTGLHVRVQVVNQENLKPAKFLDKGFLRKLQWREHPWRDWLKQHVASFDLTCVSGTDQLDNTHYSMTKEGLIHKTQGRFEKKDLSKVDDRRGWQLGFSNESRLNLLKQDAKTLTTELTDLKQQVADARNAWNILSTQAKQYEQLERFRFELINVPYWQEKKQKAESDIKTLENHANDLKKALQRYDDAKAALKAIQKQKGETLSEKGSLTAELSRAELECQRAEEQAATGLDKEVNIRLTKRIGQLTLNDGARLHSIEKTLEQAIDQTRQKKNTAENKANGLIVAFRSKDKWAPIAADWPTGLAAMEDALAHVEQLEQEGLPALIEQFKERLNKHATQSLARIQSRLESEREDINERIETINSVLKRTEFKAGSHLRLGSKREKFVHVKQFEQQLKTCLGQATSTDHEARFHLLSELVSILEKATSSSTSNTLESLRLLDPRYQMAFYAEEVDSDAGTVRDVLESSSGKSGGEKEAFAGTIVAASLAYVLTPDGLDKPVYATVFLDEAFSNTAEAVSRRVLRVFKELHIHVNLITPYKNLNLARESARSLLIAERDQDKHESKLIEVTWEEIDNQMQHRQKQVIQSSMQSLGIEIDD